MAVLTLDEIKAHLYLDLSDTSKDSHLALLNDAAQDYASQYIGRAIPWVDDLGAPVDVPASVRAALLLTIGDMFENREGLIVGVSAAPNPAVVNMLHFYRVGLGI